MINFAISDADKGVISKEVSDHIKSYFADFRRDDPSEYKRPNIKQKDLHKHVGNSLRRGIPSSILADRFGEFDSATAYSNLYLNFSNYIHGRYPEIMDMYGGIPPFFHLSGMRVEQKSKENYDVISTFIDSLHLTARHMDGVFHLNIYDQISKKVE